MGVNVGALTTLCLCTRSLYVKACAMVLLGVLCGNGSVVGQMLVLLSLCDCTWDCVREWVCGMIKL